MLNKICLVLLCAVLSPASFAQRRSIPSATLLSITKAEDERRWDDDLQKLFSNPSPLIRKRAALAAGRIGNEASISALTNLLEQDKDTSVRSMAAFALGEVESEAGANVLLTTLKNTSAPAELRSRAIEALGKIAAALPKEQEARQGELGAAILDALKSESFPSTILFGLTAALRARPANAGPVIAKFLTHPNPRVRADAANALARLRLKDGNEQLRKLLADLDPIVRANAARILGVTEDTVSFDALLARATDKDSRVRVSAIRALASLKDPRAAEPLLKRGELLAQQNVGDRPAETNEVLEIATTIGQIGRAHV